MGNDNNKGKSNENKSQVHTSHIQSQSNNTTLNHPKFNKNAIIEEQLTSNAHILVTQSVPNKSFFKNYQSKIKQFTEGNNTLPLMIPMDVSFKEEGFCGSSGIMKIKYQYFPYMLAEELENRRELNKYFQESELWYLIYVLMMSAGSLHPKGQILGDVRPLNVFINENGEVLLGNICTFPDERENYEKTRTEKQITYLSPETLQILQEGRDPKQNRQRCQCFSIGLTILDSVLLSDSNNLYENAYNFNQARLSNKIEDLKTKINNKLIIRIIEGLLDLNPKNRLKCEDIYDMLRPFEEEIVNLQKFEIKVVPKNIEKEFQPLVRQVSSKSLHKVISNASNSNSRPDLHAQRIPQVPQEDPRIFTNPPQQFIIQQPSTLYPRVITQQTHPYQLIYPSNELQPPIVHPPQPIYISQPVYNPQQVVGAEYPIGQIHRTVVGSYQGLPTQSNHQFKNQTPRRIEVYPYSQNYVSSIPQVMEGYGSQSNLNQNKAFQSIPSNPTFNIPSMTTTIKNEQQAVISQQLLKNNYPYSGQSLNKFTSESDLNHHPSSNSPIDFKTHHNPVNQTKYNQQYSNSPNYETLTKNNINSNSNIHFSFQKKHQIDEQKGNQHEVQPSNQQVYKYEKQSYGLLEQNSNLKIPSSKNSNGSLSEMGRITTSVEPGSMGNNYVPTFGNVPSYNGYHYVNRQQAPHPYYSNLQQQSNYYSNWNVKSPQKNEEEYSLYEQTLRNIDKQLRQSKIMFPEHHN